MKHVYSFIVFILFSLSTQAQTIGWDAGGDGVTWNDPLNWNTDVLPTTTDRVFISSGNSYTITIVASTTAFCSSIFLGNDATLTVKGSLSSPVTNEGNNSFDVSGGIVLNDGTISFEDAGDNGIDITSGGSFTNNGIVEILGWGGDRKGISIGSGSTGSGTLINRGTITLTSTTTITDTDGILLGADGELQNATGGVINLNNISGTASNDVTTSSGAVILNDGTINCFGTGSSAFNNLTDLTNNGNIAFPNSGGLRNTALGFYKGMGSITGGLFKNSGAIFPGNSVGSLSFEENLVMEVDGAGNIPMLTIEIDGAAGPGVANGHDQIQVSGNVDLTGILNITLGNGFVPPSGSRFPLLTYTGTLTGAFTTVNLPSPELDGWELDYSQPGEVALQNTTCTGGVNTWTGSGDGVSWEDAMNWDQNRVPLTCDDARIWLAGTSVTINSSAVVASINMMNDVNLSIPAGVTLTIDGSLSSFSSVSGISSSGNNKLLNDGEIFIRNTEGSGLVFGGGLISNNNAIEIENYGDQDGINALGLAINSGTELINDGDLTITSMVASQNSTGLVLNMGSELNNLGTISINSIAGPSSAGILNLGNLSNTSAGTIQIDGVAEDFGLDNQQNLTNNGSIIISNVSSAADVINREMLEGNGSFDVTEFRTIGGGIVSPGLSPGQLAVTGLFNLVAPASLNIEIDGTAGQGMPGGHDHVTVTGDVQLTGVLDIELNGFVPDPGDVFPILTYSGNLTGTFSSTDIATELPAGWDVYYNPAGFPNQIVLAGPASILPVELASFTAFKDGEAVVLNWITASETNNEGFEVQHSLNGVNWDSIGWVQGAGNSADNLEYEFLHHNPEVESNYYRLKQIDFDGAFEFSDIQQVDIDVQASIILYPNPAVEELNITGLGKEAELELRVFNVNGQLLKITDYKQGQSVDVSGFISGQYYVQFVIGEKSITLPFSKR